MVKIRNLNKPYWFPATRSVGRLQREEGIRKRPQGLLADSRVDTEALGVHPDLRGQFIAAAEWEQIFFYFVRATNNRKPGKLFVAN